MHIMHVDTFAQRSSCHATVFRDISSDIRLHSRHVWQRRVFCDTHAVHQWSTVGDSASENSSIIKT